MNELKSIYKESADIISSWKSTPTTELCNKCIECRERDDPMADNYFSAIVLKFWGSIGKNYHNQGVKQATWSDCYNWLIDSITYCLDKHVWTDPDNSLYGDEHGAEKAINVRVSSLRANFYYLAKMKKRVVNYNSLSLDRLSENSSDDFFTPTTDEDETIYNMVSEYIQNYFARKDYFPAFVLDAVLNADVFNDVGDYSEFSQKKLRKHLRDLNDDYCGKFAEKYGLEKEVVVKSLKYIVNLSQQEMDDKIETFFFLFRKKNKRFKSLLMK